ncbi:biotin-dependent carboxyltransferase family protein [Paenalcaligenes niemegkensis]|uniref:5-oxoprolinase subunit C family protein n=1 Tax=Paenalcaligenes niemegkensis TaxID=2895469 RepID=UPI001EE8FE24|nr:biotin-dependent carboxyltransferase family protein [Paenalcaligenes niemegkensis]MCQ9618018.1 biotin-dependent carboxyltransferase family protein [Paenalcaligenes niemegkensis]
MSIDVIKPGLLSTFQDLGRRSFQHLGVPLNGVMDERAHRIANWLVGNDANEATLEITLLGPTLRFNTPAVMVVCGADLSPSINGEAIALNKVITIAAGSTLAFGARRAGLRAYLAVQGGFAIEPVMGSASTYVRAGYGGLDGGPLKKGSQIHLKPAPVGALTRALTGMPMFGLGVVQGVNASVRIVAGREYDSFAPESIQALGTESYQISPQSDRMGYRLKGPVLERTQQPELLSEAVTAGTIQVPPDGLPIVLMADSQTTGGYPRIANVAWVDLPRLAQRAPGEFLRFEWVELDQAQRLAVEQATIFRNMESAQ